MLKQSRLILLLIVGVSLALAPACGGSKQKKERAQKGTPAPTKRVQDMNAAEGLEAKAYYQERSNTDMITKILIHLKSVEHDPQMLAAITLELADLYFRAGTYEQAQKNYMEFITRFPGHAEIAGVRYRYLMSMWLQSLEPDRDQSMTKAALVQAQTFLSDFPEHELYTKKVHDIICSCYTRLLASELAIVRFYVNKFNYQATASTLEAAKTRLMALRQELLPALQTYDQAQAESWRAAIDRLEAITPTQSLQEQVAWILQQEHLLIQLIGGSQGEAVHARDRF